MTEVTPEFVRNRLAALKAMLNGEPDANEWLAATGMDPGFMYVHDVNKGLEKCHCPFCDGRPIKPVGDLGKILKGLR